MPKIDRLIARNKQRVISPENRINPWVVLEAEITIPGASATFHAIILSSRPIPAALEPARQTSQALARLLQKSPVSGSN
jgi:hypothetical protein